MSAAPQIQVVQDQLARNHVQLLHRLGRLVDAHTVAVQGKTGETTGTAHTPITRSVNRARRSAQRKCGLSGGYGF
jgi:hypothetical protein